MMAYTTADLAPPVRGKGIDRPLTPAELRELEQAQQVLEKHGRFEDRDGVGFCHACFGTNRCPELVGATEVHARLGVAPQRRARLPRATVQALRLAKYREDG